MRATRAIAVLLAFLTLGATAGAQKGSRSRSTAPSHSRALIGGKGSSHKGAHYVTRAPKATAPRVRAAPRSSTHVPRARVAAPKAGAPRISRAPTTAGGIARDSRGRIARSESAKHAFEKTTGHPNGWKGHVVDHIVPLACGGADAPSNMQWQTTEESKAKDKVERKGCSRR